MVLARRVEKKQLVEPAHYLIKHREVAGTTTGLQWRERRGGVMGGGERERERSVDDIRPGYEANKLVL